MTYFIMVSIIVIGLICVSIKALITIGWILTVAVLVSWLASKICEMLDLFGAYKFFYCVWFFGRIPAAILVALDLIVRMIVH